MKHVTLAVLLLGLASLLGCSSDGEAVKRAQADADAAKAELAKVKAELDQLKAQVAAQDGKNQSAAAAQEAVKDAAFTLFAGVRQGRARTVYEDSMSAAYKKRVDRKAFDQLIENAGVFRWGSIERAALGVRKHAKDNAYECECPSLNMGNVVMRLVHEDGAWKIDDFLEFTTQVISAAVLGGRG